MNAPIVLRRADEKRRWLQFLIVRDNAVTIIDLEPAYLYGWRVRRIDRQGEHDWLGMNALDIVTLKLANDDGLTRHATDEEREIALQDEQLECRLSARAT